MVMRGAVAFLPQTVPEASSGKAPTSLLSELTLSMERHLALFASSAILPFANSQHFCLITTAIVRSSCSKQAERFR